MSRKKNAQRRVGLRFIRETFADGQPRPCEYCAVLVLNGVRRRGYALATADHRVPISRGGADALPNLAVSCKPCNSRKGSLTADEFTRLNHPRRKAQT